MTISKSQYMRGLQCHKSLWLHKNKSALKDKYDNTSMVLYDAGINLGQLAQSLFPDGTEVQYDATNLKKMLSTTQDLIKNGTKVIYEATFSENGVLVMVDILVKNGDTWDMYEVKGTTNVKTKQGRTKAKYLYDVAIQWYTLSKILKLNKAYLVYLDKKYTRNGALEVEKLFVKKDISIEVIEEQVHINDKLTSMENMLTAKDMPKIDIGRHCSSPYRCDFHKYCWQDIPEDSIFKIAYAKKAHWSLYEKGIISMRDVPDNFPLEKRAKKQLKSYKANETHIDKPKIQSFIEKINYPINFLDFETFQSPIPRFDGQKPYIHIPFQYSLHILHEDGRLEHKEFLANEHNDPRGELAKDMLKNITEKGSIVAYKDTFEKSQIKNLALFLPDIKNNLLALNKRFIDLAEPFSKRYYYHPKFHGRHSIKVVLPTLFPEDSKLNYKNLGSIQNGLDAMNTFEKLHRLQDKSKREIIRQDLLIYCHLDTLAMVKILEKLNELVYE